jgi:hypothetical protein
VQERAESGPEPRPAATATAYGIKVLLPNQEPIVGGLVDGPGSAKVMPVPFAYPADGSIVQAESVAARLTAASLNVGRCDRQTLSQRSPSDQQRAEPPLGAITRGVVTLVAESDIR